MEASGSRPEASSGAELTRIATPTAVRTENSAISILPTKRSSRKKEQYDE